MPSDPPPLPALAWFDGRLATGLVETTDDAGALAGGGWWALVQDFEGRLRAARFSEVRPAPLPWAAWDRSAVGAWSSSLDRAAYVAGVRDIRGRIARGDLYQVNLCRVLSATVAGNPDVVGLAYALQAAHRAPHLGVLRVPGLVEVASASPELFLRRWREGTHDLVESGPVKGTGVRREDLTAKDRAENVMIVDLVRNDLGRVAVTGGVSVPELCEVQEHPGLVHLVSRVRARLRPGTSWADLLGAASPPGSVSGAPKAAALGAISELEPVARGAYCGAVGWIDADAGEAVLAVGIRTFSLAGSILRFGTGAGITWGSDPVQEWRETSLKARRLLAVASNRPEGLEQVP